jgi:hypothetical protein
MPRLRWSPILLGRLEASWSRAVSMLLKPFAERSRAQSDQYQKYLTTPKI